MSEDLSSEDTGRPGAAQSLKSLLQHAAGLLGARLSLALLEIGEARDAFITVFVLAIAALVTASLTLIAASALIIVLAWDAMGWWVILFLTIVYAGLSWLLWRAARSIILEGRLGLPQTMAELRQDRDALFPKDSS